MVDSPQVIQKKGFEEVDRLVMGSRHLVRKSSSDEMPVYRYLCSETSYKPTSGAFVGDKFARLRTVS